MGHNDDRRLTCPVCNSEILLEYRNRRIWSSMSHVMCHGDHAGRVLYTLILYLFMLFVLVHQAAGLVIRPSDWMKMLLDVFMLILYSAVLGMLTRFIKYDTKTCMKEYKDRKNYPNCTCFVLKKEYNI